MPQLKGREVRAWKYGVPRVTYDVRDSAFECIGVDELAEHLGDLMKDPEFATMRKAVDKLGNNLEFGTESIIHTPFDAAGNSPLVVSSSNYWVPE